MPLAASAKVRSAYLDQSSVTWVSMPYLFFGEFRPDSKRISRSGVPLSASAKVRSIPFHFIPIHSLLFYSILFYFILFYSILFYSILFYSILFYSILFYSILFYSIYCSILWLVQTRLEAYLQVRCAAGRLGEGNLSLGFLCHICSMASTDLTRSGSPGPDCCWSPRRG